MAMNAERLPEFLFDRVMKQVKRGELAKLQRHADSHRPPTQEELRAYIDHGFAADHPLVYKNAIDICKLMDGGADLKDWRAIHLAWRKHGRYRGVSHPLELAVGAWMASQPHGKETSPAKWDDAILQTNWAMTGEEVDLYRPKRGKGKYNGRFQKPAHLADVDGERVALPGFAGGKTLSAPTVPLEWLEAGVAEGSTAQCAPLAMRLHLECLLCVPIDRRGEDVLLRTDLRSYIAMVYGDRPPRKRDCIASLEQAARIVNGMATPFVDAKGRNRKAYMVHIKEIPGKDAGLDDPIFINVFMPKGEGTGPAIFDRERLRLVGRKSAIEYRMLLNLHYVWWHPGVTRIRTKDGYRWVRDKSKYPVLTDDQLIDLAFPQGSDDLRRRQLARAKQAVRSLAKQGAIWLPEAEGHKHHERLILPPLHVFKRLETA